jgi:hypothetical protein
MQEEPKARRGGLERRILSSPSVSRGQEGRQILEGEAEADCKFTTLSFKQLHTKSLKTV